MNDNDAKSEIVKAVAQTTEAGRDWLAQEEKRKERMRALFASIPEKPLPHGK